MEEDSSMIRRRGAGISLCQKCGQSFKWSNLAYRVPKYCSKCRYKKIDKVKKNCEECGGEYSVIPYRLKRTRFCSRKCRINGLRGEKNPQWKGGSSKYYSNDIGWKQARKLALERDKYTCQICGLETAKEVHHIVPYRLSKSHELINLISLGDNCHDLFEKDTAKALKDTGFGGHPLYTQLITRAWLIHLKKNFDYSKKEDPLFNFRLTEEFGVPAWKGVLIRLSDKWSRLVNLAGGKEAQVKEETLEDTLIDLANYSLLCIILLRESRKK